MVERIPKNHWLFYYDGECPFCIAAVRLLAGMDFFRKVTWIPFQELAAPPEGLAWEDLDREVYLDTGARKGSTPQWYPGYYACRRLSLRLLPLIPLAPLLWLPWVDRLGGLVYRWVARNRYRISDCGGRGPGK